MFNKVKSSVKGQAVKHAPSRETIVFGVVDTLKKLYGDTPNNIIDVIEKSISKKNGDTSGQFLSLSSLLYYAIDLNKDYNKNKSYLERIINIIIDNDADDAKFSTGYIFLVHHYNRLGNKINDYYNRDLKESTEICIPFMLECVYRNFDYLCGNNDQFIAWKKTIIGNKISFDFLTYMMDNTLKNIVSWDQFYSDLPNEYKLGVVL